MNRDESMALVVDASFLTLCAMRTLEVRRSSRRAALRTSPPAHRRLVALSAAAPPPPPPLQVALECHSTLPPGWRDEAAAKRWAAVLAAIYVPTQPLPKQGLQMRGPMLLAVSSFHVCFSACLNCRISSSTPSSDSFEGFRFAPDFEDSAGSFAFGGSS